MQPEQPEAPAQPVQPAPTEQWQQPAMVSPEPHAYEGPAPAINAEAMAAQEAAANQEVAARQPLDGEDEAVRWQAAEYIYRDKDLIWYVGFGVVTIVLIAAAILLFDSITFAILVPIMAAAVIVMSRRPPQTRSYTLSRKGLHIDDQLYSYSEFREFGLVTDDDQNSIMLIPRKRFRLGVTVYFPEEAGEAIVDTLAARLPMKQIKLDPIDRLVRFLRI